MVAMVFVLGTGAQWIAWRFKIPSILLLLIFGFLAGPVTGVLDAQALGDDWVFPFVAVSVGIILFEGGLSLRLDELREVGQAVFNLITIGVLVTWGLAAGAAYLLLDFDFSLSIIIGAILTVTGPTVIVPLLRHVRPNGRVGTIAKWEGITIDPIGAILAVLVLEAVLLVNEPIAAGSASGVGGISRAVLHTVEGLLMEAFIGLGAGIIGAGVLILLLRRRLIPDFLQNPVALMVVVSVFALSDVLQEEAGLVSTTFMGIILANQKIVSIRRIIEFKEDLRVLLISFLFIILSARVDPASLHFIGVGTFAFLAVLMLVVRPASVLLSTIGTNLRWPEKAFLGWLAPRGVVAAAVASLFSFRLQEMYPVQADGLVPIVFLIIVGTVAIYGLTITPLARWLGVAQPNPQGVLLIGAHDWARRMAQVIQEQDFRVLLVDSNARNVRQAQAMGLEAQQENVLAEGVMDYLDLGGIGRLLAVTPNDEVNALVALHFSESFESSEIFQLSLRDDQRRERSGDLPQHLRGRPLFGKEVTYASLTDRFEAGAEIVAVRVEEKFELEQFLRRYGETATPLFLIRGGTLHVFSDKDTTPVPGPGHLLIVLVDPDVSLAEGELVTEETDRSH